MPRPATVAILAFAFGLLPVVRDVCGPECAMGDAPIVVAAAAPGDDVASEDSAAECPLHAAEDQAPRHAADGCTHDHGSVSEAPRSPSALAPSVPRSLELPVAAFSWTVAHLVADHRGHAVVSRPFDRAPQLLALRV